MGTAESKGNHRHRTNKHFHYKNERPIVHKCQHKTKQSETLIVGNKNSIKRKNETIGKCSSVLFFKGDYSFVDTFSTAYIITTVES
jgi:hypothetical protein